MMFGVFQVFILCIFLGQIRTNSAGSNPWIDNIRENINGVSEQFVNDYTNLHEKFVTDYKTSRLLSHGLLVNLFEKSLRNGNGKIDVTKVKEYYKTEAYLSRPSGKIAMVIDELKILKSVLSKQMPSEQYNGMVNLLYIFSYPNATKEEIQSALNYLYGVDTAATQTSFLDAHDFPDLKASDCPELFQNYSDTVDKLKSINGIRTTILQEFNTIHEKFPCNYFVYSFLLGFVDRNMVYHNDACLMANATSTKNMGPTAQILTTAFAKAFVQSVEQTLPTRLPAESFRSVLSYAKATITDTPIAEIQEALEYVYENVPEKECPEVESSKLKN